MNLRNIFKNPLNIFFPKKMVGVDIGTSSVKLIELSRWGKGITLENYGQVNSSVTYEKEALPKTKKNESPFDGQFAIKAIKNILKEAKIKTKQAVFSLPDFSTFSASFEIPPLPQKEMQGAISFNASKYITLPISEVTLDYKTMPVNPGDSKSATKVFLVAVPNQIVKEYQKIAFEAGLQLYALEAETLSASRVLIKNRQDTVCLMDIGLQSSTINIIDKGFLRLSYSFNFYSKKLSNAVSSALGVSYEEAERIKKREGIISPKKEVSEALYLLIDPLLSEIKNIFAELYRTDKKTVKAIYLTGGTANLPGLKEYMAENFKIEVEIPNCFQDILYPPILEGTLKEMSAGFSVAVGAALGGLEI